MGMMIKTKLELLLAGLCALAIISMIVFSL